MRILVCGGRDYGHVVRTMALTEQEPEETLKKVREYQYIHDVLNRFVMTYSKLRKDDENWLPTDIVIIEGGATGADSAAADFAIVQFCQVAEYKADWKKHGSSAGPIRDRRMVEEGKPDLVVAFPGGKGTANMIATAKAYGVPVVVCDGVNLPNPTPDQK